MVDPPVIPTPTPACQVMSQSLSDFSYSVSRVYMGNVNKASTNGRELIEGRMELYDESKDYTNVDDTNAASVRPFSRAPPHPPLSCSSSRVTVPLPLFPPGAQRVAGRSAQHGRVDFSDRLLLH
jgi:hypothetical protein